MSKTIDERVVSMQFDNAQFEKNVSTSMSTLDKLKKSLNLEGASKGLENINSATKGFDISPMSNGVETVRAKFSALEVMAVTALANITNSAVNAGKRLVSAFTIDPIKSGFQEYETQINAVQTILANTASKGTNLQQVNDALDELNTYADKTIYNFTEITRNIGTFTAAGIDLDTSVNAIQGIANLAAVSGSTSQQASTAMYQLSQALAAGTVKLMDWNSVVNAGMGGEMFQNALRETSELLGTGAEAAIKAQGSFRESLSTGWLTSQVLTETLKKFTTSGANERVAEYTGLTKEAVEETLKAAKAQYGEADAIEYASKALAEKSGKNAEEIKSVLEFAKNAEDAATKVKTFSQLMDTLKEAAQSGWTQTWELIIGDFDQAKELFTGLSNVFGDLINRSSEARNNLLAGALGNPFSDLMNKIESVTGATEAMTKATKDYGDIVDRVINGEFGSGQKRFEALSEAGYDWAHVQNLINERLGDSTRHATDYKEAQDDLNKSQKTTIEDLIKMSDAQLKNLNFTDDEIKAFRDLEKQSKQTGIPIKDLIEDMDQLNGRTLLLNSFKNIGQSIVTIFRSIGQAWRDVFPAMKSEQLYNIIAAFHKFSTHLKISDETADKLRRTFAGLFSIIDILTTIVGGGFKMAFKVVSTVLGAFDLHILDVTAAVGDAIVAFDKWLFENGVFARGIQQLAKALASGVKKIKEWIDAFLKLPEVQKAIDAFKDKLFELKDVGKNAIEGLKNGLEDGIKSLPNILIEIGKALLEAIKGVLGIHSPSTEMYAVGTNIIDGLINGIKDGASRIWETIKGIGSSIIEALGNFDWSKIFAGGVSIVLLMMAKKLIGILDALTAPFDGFGSMMSGLGKIFKKSAKPIAKVIKSFSKVVKSFSEILNSIAFSIKAKAIKDIAVAIAILAGSLFLLAQLDYGKLWSSVIAIGALAVVLGVLSHAIGKMDSIEKGDFTTAKLSLMLVSMGAAILLISAAVKKIADLNPDQAKQGFLGLAGIVVAMSAVFYAFGKLVDGKQALSIDKAGKMMSKMASALLLMVVVVKLVSTLDWSAMGKGAVFITGFVAEMALVFAAFGKLTSGKTAQSISQVGSMMIKMSVALLLMVGVCKLVGTLSAGEMIKGGIFAAAFAGFVKLLLKATKVDKNHKIAKLGTVLLSISTALLLMVGVCKLIGMLSVGEMVKGAAFVGGFLVLVRALVKITTIDKGRETAKVAATLLAMSVAIGIMAGVCILLGLINLKDLAKGIVAVGLLSAFMTAMIMATRGANDVKGNLIVMTIAIATMAAAVVALSFIKPERLAGATVALSMLMGMFALIAKASGTMGAAMGSLIVMAAIIGLLAGILYGLSKLPIKKTLTISASLSLLLLSLSASCAILGVVGQMGASAFIGIAALATLVAAVGALLVSIGALVTKFTKLEEFLNKGIPILEKIGYALGSFFGNIIGGFSEGITSGLPGIGDNLSAFMNNAKDFFDGIKMVDEDSVNGVKNITKMILALAGAEFINAITSLFGQDSITELGNKLCEFGDAVISFSQKVSGNIDSAAVEAAANAGLMISKLYESLPKTGGWAQAIFGSQNLETFGTQLEAFGGAIVGFSNKLRSNGGVNASLIAAATNAGKTVAGLYEVIPKGGGWAQAIFGSQNLGTFGNQIAAFGSAIAGFSRTVSENGGISSSAIDAAVNAGKTIAGLYDALPKEKGVIEKIKNYFTGGGSMSMDEFGRILSGFGKAVSGFYSSLSGVDPGALENAVSQTKRLSNLMKGMADLDVSGVDNFSRGITKLAESGIEDFVTAFSGVDGKIAGAVSQMLRSFSTSIVNGRPIIAAAFTSLIDSSVTATTTKSQAFYQAGIALMARLAMGVRAGAGNISTTVSMTVAKCVSSLGSGQQAFYQAGITLMTRLQIGIASGGSAISSAITTVLSMSVGSITKGSAMFQQAGVLLTTRMRAGITSGSNGVRTAVNLIVTTSLTLITGRQQAFYQAGSSLMSRLRSGITTGSSGIRSTISSVLAGCVSTMNGYYGGFYNAGVHVVNGFANGISANTFRAEAKARAMAEAALNAARRALREHSPSKAFYEVGDYAGQGFVNAFEDFESKSFKAGFKMADSATKGLGKALAKIPDIISSEDDIQPTIRPVLDMSSIDSGTIDLGASITSWISSPIASLSQMMAESQAAIDASNQRVVDAVNGLREDLNNLYSSDDQEIALYVDSKKLATSLAKPMNRQLNILSKRGAY